MDTFSPLQSLLTLICLLGLGLITFHAVTTLLSRLAGAAMMVSRIAGEAIGIAAAWPVEQGIDRLDRWVARGMEWRAQRRIWRAEFRDNLSWQDFQRQLRGAAARDAVGEALALLDLAEPFSRADLDARFKRIIAGVHPDKGGSAVLARMTTDARASILKHKGWQR